MEKLAAPSTRASEATISSSGPRPLFVYGTLCARPLLAWALTGDSSRVLDIEHMTKPTRADKYIRLAVKHSDYPAVVRSQQDCVDGFLLQLESSPQRKKLDDFEGEIYTVETTTVSILDSSSHPTGELIEADIYVWAGDIDMLTSEPWELETFIKERLDDQLELFDGMEIVG